MSKSKVLAKLEKFEFPTNYNRTNVLRAGDSKYKGFVLGVVNRRDGTLDSRSINEDKEAQVCPTLLKFNKVGISEFLNF